MTSAVTFQASTPKLHRKTTVKLAGNLTPAKPLRLPPRQFTVSSLKSPENTPSTSSEPSISSELISSVGSPSIQITLSQRQFTAFNVAACVVAISATWLFCSAIPALLAFKRAAESMEKLLDVTREELPDTMAAVRLSGMEISDLTTELSDLGQELKHGVKSSTSAVRVAEERLRQFADMTSRAPTQVVINTPAASATDKPGVARNVRGIRDGIEKSRGMLSMIFAVTRFSTSIRNFFSNISSRRALNK